MKKYLMILTCLAFSSLLMAGVSAADAHIFTDTNDVILLTIGTDGTGNFTGDVLENNVKLSDTYCALVGGCDLEGPVVITGHLNITGNLNVSGTLYGDGSGLTGVTIEIADNSTLIAYQNITNIPTCGAGDMLSFDGSLLTCETPASVMDYTNLALTNESNIFVPIQNFTAGIKSDDDITLASAKSLIWADGGSVTATAGVITYKAGV